MISSLQGLMYNMYIIYIIFPMANIYIIYQGEACLSPRNELVWPSSKAINAGKQKDLSSNPLRLFCLLTSCNLWTLSCDFAPHIS